MIFKGCGVALVTPFFKNGEVNYFQLKKLIQFQIANGTDAIIILGTTGEASTISPKERIKIIKFCVLLAEKKIKVIVGCGSNSTKVATKLCLQAKLLGADASLIVTPYYNKCNQNGIIQHYKTIAKESKFPIIMYNVPSRTGVNILPETTLFLCKNKYIVGQKEASGNITQIMTLLNNKPKDFFVYSGDDGLTFLFMCLGADGVISVTANVYPAKVKKLLNYFEIKDYEQALKVHKELFNINKALFFDVNPICIKFYMNLIGFKVGETRLPLTLPSKNIQNKLKEISKQYEC